MARGLEGPEGPDGLSLRNNRPLVADRYRWTSLTFRVLTGVTGEARAALSFSRFSSARFRSLFSLFSLFLIFSFSSLFLIFSSLFLISSSLLLILSFSFLFLSIFLSFLSFFSRLWRFLAPRSTSRDTCASYNGAPRYASCGGKANPEDAGAWW